MDERKKHWLRDSATGWLPLATTIISVVTVVMAWLTLPLSALVAIVGLIVSLLLGLTVAGLLRSRRQPDDASMLETPFLLAHDADVFDRYLDRYELPE